MNVVSAVGGILGARARQRGRLAFSLTAVLAGVRVFRRMTRSSNKPIIRFAVKPGEVYEIRGRRRGR